MGRRSTNSESRFHLDRTAGFACLGMLVVGTAVKLFSQGMAATFVRCPSGRRCSRTCAQPRTCC